MKRYRGRITWSHDGVSMHADNCLVIVRSPTHAVLECEYGERYTLSLEKTGGKWVCKKPVAAVLDLVFEGPGLDVSGAWVENHMPYTVDAGLEEEGKC